MPTTRPKSSDTRLNGLKVCVVDDERDVRRGLERLISNAGARVFTAEDGVAALEIVTSESIHVVITDVRMPRMTGPELLTAIKKQSPSTEVIVMTGFGSIELAVSCMAAGAAHFLAKPSDNHQMLRVIGTIHRRLLPPGPNTDRPDSRLVASDPKMLELVEHIHQVAQTRIPVLVEGESGTGKELVAQEIHRISPFHHLPFRAVNCAALPDTLLESELFGHRAGAFTGADSDRVGLFASAKGGTVFLDEVSSMSAAFQAKLLRVLQESSVRPLGTNEEVKVDFRLVGATNRPLDEMVEAGEFRADLLYRLRVLHLHIPPLRERPADIAALSRRFVERWTPECRGPDATPPTISSKATELLGQQSWPGNVRELESAVIRALVASKGATLEPHHFDACTTTTSELSYEDGKKQAIASFQRRFVEQALSNHQGNISHAAKACGLTRAALQKIMRTLDIKRDRFQS